MDDASNQQAPRYRLAAEIGRGGMGEVMSARDEQIGRDVAVKRMRASNPSAREVQRFMREARIQGRLQHPAIVPVHELGRDAEGRPFFAMKKLAGTTLAQILATPDAIQFPRQRLLRAFVDVCLAIELAHTHGVVHRDLKPDNIMLGDFGEVYVLDWGVAKLIGDAADGIAAEPHVERESAEVVVTAVGAAIGTPGYMSPEQVRGDADIGPRSDVYALGAMLFEILAALPMHPRGAAALLTTVHGTQNSPHRRAPDRDVPPELDALCVAATQIPPGERIATARELAAGVERFLDGDRDLAQRRELARTHLAAANVAFASGAIADRAIAMREAGRALALDPKLNDAAELVTRLMLEPPRETPAEVTQELAAEAVATRVANARVARWVFIAYALLLPPLALGARWRALAVLAVCIAGCGALTWSVSSKRRPPPLIVFAIGNSMLIAVIAHIYSPVLLAPLMAAMTGVILSRITPDSVLVKPVGMILVLTAAPFLPWLGEVIGVLPRTQSFDDGGIHLFGAAMAAGPTVTIVMIAATFFASIILGVAIATGVRNSDSSSRLRLHLQAWQLRQLVR